MEKILVTGGSGLVGYAIQKLSPGCIFMSSKDCDLTDYNETYKYFDKIRPKYVIHLAADVGGLYKNMNNPASMFENNLMINFNVLKCCKIFNVLKTVSCLSTCIYPDNCEYPITEDQLHDGAPHESNYSYAYAKRMLEVQSRAYNSSSGENRFICIIPTNIYGENDNYDMENGHVIPALIHKCYLAKLNNKPFVIFGSGTPLRQFIYSEDLAKLILKVLTNFEDSLLILSTDEKDEISIREVALKIAKLFDVTDIIFDETKSDGQYKKTVSNDKLKNWLPDFCFIDFDIGLKCSVDWFIENYEFCRNCSQFPQLDTSSCRK